MTPLHSCLLLPVLIDADSPAMLAFFCILHARNILKMRGDTIVIRFLGLLSVVMVCAAFVVIAGCFWGGAPKWVKDGGGAFQSDTKAFYAVGAIKGIKNKPVATKTADNRARGRA